MEYGIIDIIDRWGRCIDLNSYIGWPRRVVICQWPGGKISVYWSDRLDNTIQIFPGDLEDWFFKAIADLSTPAEVIIDYLIERGPAPIADLLGCIRVARPAEKQVRT